MGRQGSTTRHASAALAAALCCAALTGCPGAAEIAVGSAPAPAAKVSLARPDDTGFVPLATWPQACDLISDADIRAVLPAVTKVDRKPQGLEMPNLDLGGPQRITTATGALCTADIWMDGVHDPEDKATTLEVRVRMAGTPKLAKSNYDRFMKQVGPCPTGAVGIGVDACSRSGSSWAFLKNGIAVEFTGYRPTLAEDARYQGQQGDDDSVVWEDRVIPELVRAVAAKLP
jgi:hypothetical protein